MSHQHDFVLMRRFGRKGDYKKCYCGAVRQPRLLLIEEAHPILVEALVNYRSDVWEDRATAEDKSEDNREIKIVGRMLAQLSDIAEEYGWERSSSERSSGAPAAKATAK